MPNDVQHNKEAGIIEVRAYGALLKLEIEQALDQARAISEQAGTHKLTDVEAGPSTLELFDVSPNLPCEIRHALLNKVPKPIPGDVRFYETVAMNRGQPIKVFTDREEAFRWLNE